MAQTYTITGANGFIAGHMIQHLIEAGHKVRGTVRNAAESGEFLKSLGAEVYEVKSLDDAEALKAAFTGVAGVFHMAAVHPEYGFAETPEGREGILKTAVDGTLSVIDAAKAAGVPRLVLTSSLAAIECGNDDATLTEETWSKPEVYDSEEKLMQTQWSTHYTYVKSKVEQEKAAVARANEIGLDMRVVVPGNLCIGPLASRSINGTMTRLKDIMGGTNSLKGAADLAIVHVADVARAHAECMTNDEAHGRYIVAGNMATIEEIFTTLKQLYPSWPVAELNNMDIASGVPGKARKVESRVESELGIALRPYQVALKDAIDSMVSNNILSCAA